MKKLVLLIPFLIFTLAPATADAQRRRAVSHPGPPSNPLYTHGGHPATPSVTQGGTLPLHIATSVSPFTAEIVDLRTNQVVKTIPNLISSTRDCTGGWSNGCNWPVTTTIDIPMSWPSGFYAARFPTAAGERNAFFVVRAANPGRASRTLVVSSTHTFQAYNSFGGKSLYPSNSPERTFAVTYSRPYHDDRGFGRFRRWEKPFVDWMTAEGRSFEAASDVDLEDPTLLAQYDLVVFIGHSEYWTAGARANIESYSAAGGHVAIFGGNTMWWQARLSGNLLTVHKDAASDPEATRNPHLTTVNFYNEPVHRPENTIVGASFRHAGYVNRDDRIPVEQRLGYKVVDPTHWLFNGLGAQVGDEFGKIAAGLEVDGVLYNCDRDGAPSEVEGSDGTPLNYHILAYVPATSGRGTVGIFTNRGGGAVFNAGTQDWVLGLASDRYVQTITRNAMNRLSTGALLPVDEVVSTVRFRELFNCPIDATEKKVIAGWRGDEADIQFVSRCSYEGPAGAELSGQFRIALTRDITPTGELLSRLENRFYINADGLNPTQESHGLYTLQSRANGVVSRAARVELDPKTKSVRGVLYTPDGVTGARTNWLPLGNGWRSVQFGWRSPGTVTLQIDDQAPVTLENAFSGQGVTELLLFQPADPSATNGFLCVDAMAAGLDRLPPVAPLK